VSAAPGAGALLAIAVTALAARGLYLAQTWSQGLLSELFLDSRYYERVAHAIRSGLGAGDHPYLLSPLYPYLLAPFVGLDGELAAWKVRAVQAVAGSATAVLAALVAARLGGRGAGLLAGFATALYGPLIHLDAGILVASLQGLTLTLALWLLLRADDRAGELGAEARPGAGRAWLAHAAAGLAFGASAALRPTGLAVAGAVVLGLLARGALARPRLAGLRGALPRAAALALGVALCVLPFTLRNRLVAGEWVLLSANGGVNLYIGNHADATGVFRLPPDYDFVNDPLGRLNAERALGREVDYREASAWWRGRALADVRADPGGWLRRMGHKLALFLHPLEIPQLGHNFQWFRQRAWALRLPLDGCTVLLLALACPLLVGLAGGRAGLRGLTWPLVVAATYAAAICLFFVTGRYRAPLMPTALALAAVSTTTLWRFARGRSASTVERPVALLASAAALVVAVLAAPRLYERGALELHAVTGTEERHMGQAMAAQGRWEEAVEWYRRSLAVRAAAGLPDSCLVRTNLANALKRVERWEEARAEYRRALALDPTSANTWYNLGNLLRDHDLDPVGAEECYRRTIALQPRMPEAHFNLGVVLFRTERPAEAAAAMDAFLQVAPPTHAMRRAARDILGVARARLELGG